MGTSYSIKKHYPFDLQECTDSFKRIGVLNSKYRHFILNQLIPGSYSVIIILSSYNLDLNNYNEISNRLNSHKQIVIIVKINTSHQSFINTKNQSQSFFFNLVKNLKNDFIILFNINLSIDKIIIIGHQTSCIHLLQFVTFANHIILMDPKFENFGIMMDLNSFHDNMSIILSDQGTQTSDNITLRSMQKLSNDVYILKNVDSVDMFNIFNSNPKEYTNKSYHWDQLTEMIINISHSIKIIHKDLT